MSNYIDGFVFPIAQDNLTKYKAVAEKIAKIWKEHGAIAYKEFLGDDLKLEGTRPFPEALGANVDETIIFGWVEFDSRETRDHANKLVANDPRMVELTKPWANASRIIFDASRMGYGGFQSFIQK